MTRIPVSTGLSAHISRFRIAISEEIQALRVNQNRMIPLTDGYRLGRRGGQYLYSFTTDTEVLFPDDTEVTLRHRGKDHDGTLISIDDSNIIISLDSNIGDKVPSVQMYAEPWFLLSELMERLSGIIDSQQANHELAISLLSSRTASIPTNQETFEDYSTGIDVVRTVSENCSTIKFTSHSFEED